MVKLRLMCLHFALGFSHLDSGLKMSLGKLVDSVMSRVLTGGNWTHNSIQSICYQDSHFSKFFAQQKFSKQLFSVSFVESFHVIVMVVY